MELLRKTGLTASTGNTVADLFCLVMIEKGWYGSLGAMWAKFTHPLNEEIRNPRKMRDMQMFVEILLDNLRKPNISDVEAFGLAVEGSLIDPAKIKMVFSFAVFHNIVDSSFPDKYGIRLNK